jgi:hypothetical protein
MRSAVTVVLWLATTLALAVAVPAVWTQLNVISEGGYTALSRRAATDPALQSAAADELTNRAMALIAAHSGGRGPVDSAEVHDAAVAFTAGPAFPSMFAGANAAAHRWLFSTDGSGDSWTVDVAPMLNDASIQRILASRNAKVPATLSIPLTVSVPGSWRQGELSRLATWGPRVSIGATAASGLFALLTLAAARRRGRALAGLGVSALLVGAAGWAGIEAGDRYLNGALNHTTGDIRRIAEVMVGHAEASMRQWLDLTLLAGAALVGLGVLVAIVGGLRKDATKKA